MKLPAYVLLGLSSFLFKKLLPIKQKFLKNLTKKSSTFKLPKALVSHLLSICHQDSPILSPTALFLPLEKKIRKKSSDLFTWKLLTFCRNFLSYIYFFHYPIRFFIACTTSDICTGTGYCHDNVLNHSLSLFSLI